MPDRDSIDRQNKNAANGSSRQNRNAANGRNRQYKRVGYLQLLFGRVSHRDRARQVRARLFTLGGAVLLIVLLIVIIAAAKGTHKDGDSAADASRDAQISGSEDGSRITLGATGCVLLHSPFLNHYADAEGNYDFSDCFRYIRDYYSAPDYMTAEFEGTVELNPVNYSAVPNFRCPEVIIDNLSDAGIDLQLTATNHAYDGGSAGVVNTAQAFKDHNLLQTGLRTDTEEKNYYVADVKGIKIGYVDYTYGTMSNFNGAEMEDDGTLDLINNFDPEDPETLYGEMAAVIAGMKLEGAEFIVANMHWGYEYETTECEYQEEIAQRFCDMGVDALIGGHPHVVQPIDYLTSSDGSHNMFVIYSVGNILSNQMTEYLVDEPSGHTEDGVMVTMTLDVDDEGEVILADVDLLPTWCHRINYYADETTSDTTTVEESDDNITDVNYYILPLDDVDGLEELTGLPNIRNDAQESYDRTMEILGPGLEKVKEALGTAV